MNQDLNTRLIDRRQVWTSRLEAWSLRSLAISLGALLVAGGAYSASFGNDVRYFDEGDYLDLARTLDRLGRYTSDGVHPTAFRPPGYPFLLGGLLRVGVPESALRGANVLLMALVVWACWWLARRLSGAAAATLVAPLVAFYPLSFYTMGTLYPQTLGSALFLGSLVLIGRVLDDDRRWIHAIGAGVLFGLLIVTIPSFALTLLVIVGWLARRRLWTPAVVLVATAAVVPGLWTLRNIDRFDAVVFISTNSGLNLLLGNSEHAGPRTGVNADISAYLAEADARRLDEVESNRYLTDSATTWITDHPVDAGVLFVEKTLNYFAPFDDLATGSESSRAVQLVACVGYVPLLALLAVRLAGWRRDPPGQLERLLIVLYLSAAPFQAVFFTRVRFRVPLDPLLIVCGACFLARLVHARASASGPIDADPAAAPE